MEAAKKIVSKEDIERTLDAENLGYCSECSICTAGAWCYHCNKRCPQAMELPKIFLLIETIVIGHGYTQPLEKAFDKIGENFALPLITTLASIEEGIKVVSCRSGF